MREPTVPAAVQLVGYEPSGRGSALRLSDGETVSRHPLEPGTELAYGLGDRRCAGAVDGDVHYPCDRPATPYCEHHADTWVCARCTGTCLKDEMDCYQDHAVYLAAFAPATFKVGVTRLERLETRLHEQGADRGVHVHTVSNGRIAREIEAEIATRLIDRVRTPPKVASLSATVDEDAWEELLAGYDVRERFSFEYGLELSSRPVRETIAAGTVRGVKGRLLVLDRGRTSYAVDLRDLVGYELETDRRSRRLQSSLGAF